MLSGKPLPSPQALKKDAQLNIYDHLTFIDHQKLRGQELFEFGFEAVIDLGGGQHIDDVHRGGKEHRVAG